MDKGEGVKIFETFADVLYEWSLLYPLLAPPSIHPSTRREAEEEEEEGKTLFFIKGWSHAGIETSLGGEKMKYQENYAFRILCVSVTIHLPCVKPRSEANLNYGLLSSCSLAVTCLWSINQLGDIIVALSEIDFMLN